MLFVVVRYYRKRPRTYGERFVSLLKKYGYEKEPGETLLDLVSRVKSEKPLLVGKNAMSFIQEYYRIEFGQNRCDEKLAKLFNILKMEIGK